MAECDVLGDERQPVSAVHLERNTVGSIAIAVVARTPSSRAISPKSRPGSTIVTVNSLVTRPRTRMNARTRPVTTT